MVRRLLEQCDLPLALSVSATTRPPRAGERDGQAYHFLSPEAFADKRRNGEFLECKEVFGRGDWYGTLREEVATSLSQGKWVILEIDVRGAMSVIEQIPGAITIFIHPGSLEELQERLERRGTDTADAIQRRLEVARQELTYVPKYRHEVINQRIDDAVREICGLLEQYNTDDADRQD